MVQVISVTIFKNMYPIFVLTSSMRLVTLRLGHLRGLYMVGSTALVRLVSELEQGLHVFSNHEASHIKQSDKIPIQNMKRKCDHIEQVCNAWFSNRFHELFPVVLKGFVSIPTGHDFGTRRSKMLPFTTRAGTFVEINKKFTTGTYAVVSTVKVCNMFDQVSW